MRENKAKTAVIIANGEFPSSSRVRKQIVEADYIICCDGALQTFLKESENMCPGGLVPNAVVGDLDSVDKYCLDRYRHHDKSNVVHIPEQETNDLTKAFSYINKNYPDVNYIKIIAATGKREDHTIANMSLLMEYASKIEENGKPLEVEMLTDYCDVLAITNSVVLHIGKGKSISIFSPDPTLTIKSVGLEWPTDDVIFDNWWKASLNRTSSDETELNFSHKSMALIVLPLEEAD